MEKRWNIKPTDTKRLQDLQQSLKINPNDIETHLNLGVAFARQDRIEEAIGHYRKALEIDSRYAPAHNNLGNLLLRQGRVDQAVDCYRAAVEIDPGDAEYRHNLSVGLRQLGDRQQLRSRAETRSRRGE